MTRTRAWTKALMKSRSVGEVSRARASGRARLGGAFHPLRGIRFRRHNGAGGDSRSGSLACCGWRGGPRPTRTGAGHCPAVGFRPRGSRLGRTHLRETHSQDAAGGPCPSRPVTLCSDPVNHWLRAIAVVLLLSGCGSETPSGARLPAEGDAPILQRVLDGTLAPQDGLTQVAQSAGWPIPTTEGYSSPSSTGARGLIRWRARMPGLPACR
jgi:hypothetical protein